jgi:hypothetical protein
VLCYFPLTAPTTMMLRLPLIAIPIVLWCGAKIFHIALLLTGKRAIFRQVLRAVREA